METTTNRDEQESTFEERAVAFVLFAAGVIGVGIGVSVPRVSGVELAIGCLLAALGVWTWMRAARTL